MQKRLPRPAPALRQARDGQGLLRGTGPRAEAGQRLAGPDPCSPARLGLQRPAEGCLAWLEQRPGLSPGSSHLAALQAASPRRMSRRLRVSRPPRACLPLSRPPWLAAAPQWRPGIEPASAALAGWPRQSVGLPRPGQAPAAPRVQVPPGAPWPRAAGQGGRPRPRAARPLPRACPLSRKSWPMQLAPPARPGCGPGPRPAAPRGGLAPGRRPPGCLQLAARRPTRLAKRQRRPPARRGRSRAWRAAPLLRGRWTRLAAPASLASGCPPRPARWLARLAGKRPMPARPRQVRARRPVPPPASWVKTRPAWGATHPASWPGRLTGRRRPSAHPRQVQAQWTAPPWAGRAKTRPAWGATHPASWPGRLAGRRPPPAFPRQLRARRPAPPWAGRAKTRPAWEAMHPVGWPAWLTGRRPPPARPWQARAQRPVPPRISWPKVLPA